MPLRIGSDHDRFKKIVRGKVRENLKRYVSSGEIIGQKGGELVKVPIPQIDTPRFTFDPGQKGGAGQGDGEEGDPVDGQGKKSPGKGKAGNERGEHELEVDMSLDELADLLGEELELPRIEDKGKKRIPADSKKYKAIRTVGPEGLRHFKRTYKQALKREISSGTYVPGDPVVPRREDKRYRASDVVEDAVANAAVVYMMDISGSMGEEQKEIVRLTAFWINAWLRRQYKGIETRYIVHDTEAKEVDEATFFRLRESGGTQISSAYKKCVEVMERDFPASEWNVYAMHFSDGDNWSAEDNALCFKILRDQILPSANMFAYGQVESNYGSGQFLPELVGALRDEEKLATTHIQDRDGILRAIKDLLGRGL